MNRFEFNFKQVATKQLKEMKEDVTLPRDANAKATRFSSNSNILWNSVTEVQSWVSSPNIISTQTLKMHSELLTPSTTGQHCSSFHLYFHPTLSFFFLSKIFYTKWLVNREDRDVSRYSRDGSSSSPCRYGRPTPWSGRTSCWRLKAGQATRCPAATPSSSSASCSSSAFSNVLNISPRGSHASQLPVQLIADGMTRPI